MSLVISSLILAKRIQYYWLTFSEGPVILFTLNKELKFLKIPISCMKSWYFSLLKSFDIENKTSQASYLFF